MKLLFRKNGENQEEFAICKEIFGDDVVTSRIDCEGAPFYETVVGRYSVLPHYKELQHDLRKLNAKLINSNTEHKWIANFEWYEQLSEYTPQTWFGSLANCEYDGPFIVKGKTNSDKFKFAQRMFAKNKATAIILGSEISADIFLGPQGIVYRKYIPLETFQIGLNGLPFTNEWRFFCLNNKILSYGKYWSIAEEETLNKCYMEDEGLRLVYEIIEIAKNFATFYVLDIAKTDEGKWILIEINDGQMSGLSENDPYVLYEALKKELWKNTTQTN